ncbi:hypothetical protein Q6294_32740, partial [Klebsiella pneumoniae]
FPNALLLDCGTTPVPLHLTSEFMSVKDRALKEKAIQTGGSPSHWYWHTANAIPALPNIAPWPQRGSVGSSAGLQRRFPH